MSERPRLYVAEPDDFDPDVAAYLGRHAEVVLERASHDQLGAAFQAFDAVWIRLGFRVDAALLGAAPRCRVLACPATGLDHIDREACAARGVRVESLKGEVEFLRNIRATAELTVALALAVIRKLPSAARAVLDGEWNRDRFRGRELNEKTFGIVGMGRLGSLVAQMLGGFGVRVLGYDPRPDFPLDRAERAPSLDALLAASDVVSLHVNYEASTRHLVGARELAAMRPGSFLINTSRGGVLDETALLAALERGHLGGAALDVLEGEPNPALAGHPLVEYAKRHDNLILVPHIGGNTWESTRKTEMFVARKVLLALGVGEVRA